MSTTPPDGTTLVSMRCRDPREAALANRWPLYDHSNGAPTANMQPLLGGKHASFPFRSDMYLYLVRMHNQVLLPGGLVTDGKATLYAHGLTYHLRAGRTDLGIQEYHGDTLPVSVAVPVKRRRIDGPAIGFVGSVNFGHFLFEFLPRLYPLTFSRALGELPVIVRRSMPQRFFEYLEIAGIKPSRFIFQEEDEALEVEHLWMTSIPFGRTTAGEMYFSPSALAYLRGLYTTPFRRPAAERRGRVYLDRTGATFRRLVNEAEILPALKAKGFVTMDGMKLSAREQLEVIANAEAVFSQVGSSPTITMFAPQDARIVEMFPPNVAGLFVGIAYAALLGQPYHRIVGQRVQLPDNTRTEPLYGDYTVNAAEVSGVLDAMRLAPTA